MSQSPCPACPLPALSRAGGHRGAPAKEAPGPERKGVPGWRGKEAGLNLRKLSPAAGQLPRERVGARSRALFCPSPPPWRCQAVGTRRWLHLAGPAWVSRLPRRGPTKRLMMLVGMGTASRPAAPNPGCTPHLVRPEGNAGHQLGEGQGTGCQNPRGRLSAAKKS